MAVAREGDGCRGITREIEIDQLDVDLARGRIGAAIERDDPLAGERNMAGENEREVLINHPGGVATRIFNDLPPNNAHDVLAGFGELHVDTFNIVNGIEAGRV